MSREIGGWAGKTLIKSSGLQRPHKVSGGEGLDMCVQQKAGDFSSTQLQEEGGGVGVGGGVIKSVSGLLLCFLSFLNWK